MKKVAIAFLEVHGLLVFSKITGSLKKSVLSSGAFIRSSLFIHNYPLIYGFLGYSSEMIIDIDEPRYKVVDEALEEGLYVYPAEPLHVSFTRLFLSPTPETYVVPEKAKPSIAHPLQVHYYAIAPGSMFKTVVVYREGFELPRYIRIGKKRWGIIRVRYVVPEGISDVSDTYRGYSSIPVNLGDMRDRGVVVDDYNTVLVTRNNPFIGDRSIIAYIRGRPMHMITYEYGGRVRREYLPLPWSIPLG